MKKLKNSPKLMRTEVDTRPMRLYYINVLNITFKQWKTKKPRHTSSVGVCGVS